MSDNTVLLMSGNIQFLTLNIIMQSSTECGTLLSSGVIVMQIIKTGKSTA